MILICTDYKVFFGVQGKNQVLRYRKRNSENTSFTGHALHRQIATLSLDNHLRKRKPQTDSLPVLRIFASIKPLENMVNVLL